MDGVLSSYVLYVLFIWLVKGFFASFGLDSRQFFIFLNSGRCAEFIGLFVGFKFKNVEFFIQEFASVTNVFSGFKFISGEHPNLDSSSSQVMNCVWYLVLKFILDSSCTKENKAVFKFANNVFNNFIAVFESLFGGGEFFLKGLELIFFHNSYSHTEGSETVDRGIM
jgi:hypothetical protein